MTRPAVYLGTSVVGYATSRPSRDLVVAGHQPVTREWFALRTDGYELFAFQLVASEASGGDEEAAARERAAFLHGIPWLGSGSGSASAWVRWRRRDAFAPSGFPFLSGRPLVPAEVTGTRRCIRSRVRERKLGRRDAFAPAAVVHEGEVGERIGLHAGAMAKAGRLCSQGLLVFLAACGASAGKSRASFFSPRPRA
jgi:hypothetical protein